MGFEVTTPVFEGPFDLLLHLILSEQVDIHEVSLARIVDAFLTEIERMENLDLDVATEFLLIAATLVELKARRLLPGREDVDLDEELALWEERDLLLARLLECKTFKDAAVTLARYQAEAARCFARRVGPDERFIDLAPDLLAGVDGAMLHAAYLRAVTPKPQPMIDLFHVAPIRASVVDAVAELCGELPDIERVSFRELTASLVDRIEIVVRFLAILELFKQGFVDLQQPLTFGDIEVVWIAGADSGAAALEAVDAYDG
jgi:segregation and condensation protein A